MIPIAMPLWRRPADARESLAALSRCEGVADAVLLPMVEPGCDETTALVESFDACECRPTFHPERLGCGANAEASWRAGFALADFAILVEEDIVLAPDALAYFAWARDRYRADPSVFSATAYNRREHPAGPGEAHRVARRPWFHSWGSATWRDRHAATAGGIATAPAWDGFVMRFMLDRGLSEAYPLLSRCQNIGRETTVQDPALFPPDWFDRHHRLRHWAGGTPIVSGEFREGPIRGNPSDGPITPSPPRSS